MDRPEASINPATRTATSPAGRTRTSCRSPSSGLPRDGGFGQVPTIFGSFGNTDDLPDPFGHVELEEFNSPPLVEAADTGPFFHNNAESSLEGPVDHTNRGERDQRSWREGPAPTARTSTDTDLTSA